MRAQDRTAKRGTETRWMSGYSLAELLVVIALLSLSLLIAGAAYESYKKKTDVNSAARLLQTQIYKARMFAVYRGVNHFVVLNPATKTVDIYEDSSSPFGAFDTSDVRVTGEQMPFAAQLALPSAPSPLTSPMGSGSITNAWSLPFPDTAAAWGAELRGVVATPSGQIRSAESTPQTIVTGIIVLSDPTGQTASVGIRGQMGSVRCYQLIQTEWKEL